MEREHIEFIQKFADERIYYDDRRDSLSLDKGSNSIVLTYYLFIPDKQKYHLSDINGYTFITNKELLNECRIEKIILSDGEDYSEEDDDIRELLPQETFVKDCQELQYSVSGKLFLALNRCFALFNYIPYYTLNEPEDSGFCPPSNYKYYELIFEGEKIQDAVKLYINIDTSPFIDSDITPIIYPAKNRWDIKQNKTGILQTNTKARRLGYLKFIIEEFKKSNYFPATTFARRIENQTERISSRLIEYKEVYKGDDKGLVKKSKTGNSAAPYVQLLKELNVITELNSSFILTKQAKVYYKLLEQSSIANDNIDLASEFTESNLFKLNILDEIFFVHQLILADALYLISLLDLLKIAGGPINVPTIKKHFREYLLDELERTISSFYVSNQVKREAMELKKRILSWKEPKVYLGHIIEPRLNWLLDLEIVAKSEGNYYQLSDVGGRLMNIIYGVQEAFQMKLNALHSFAENHFFTSISYIYNLKSSQSPVEKELIDRYLEEAFKYFKTDAPNRIAASQAINYVCYKVLLKDNQILEFNEVKSYLSNKASTLYKLDWFKTENDGSLSKIKA